MSFSPYLDNGRGADCPAHGVAGFVYVWGHPWDWHASLAGVHTLGGPWYGKEGLGPHDLGEPRHPLYH